MSLSMDLENFFHGEDVVDLMLSDVPMTSVRTSCSDKFVESSYSTEAIVPSFKDDLMSCYPTHSISLSHCSESESSSTTSSRAQSVTSCEGMRSQRVCLSDDANSHCDFDEIFPCETPSDNTFSDLIIYDDVFELKTVEGENTPNEHQNIQTRISRAIHVRENVGIPETQQTDRQSKFKYTPRYSQSSKCANVSTKPRRKRTQSSRQRSAANVRERNRMVYLNTAFNVLKNKLPGLNNKRLSRIETLRTAISYIKCMENMTS